MPDVGAQKLPEWGGGVLRQEVRVLLSVEGRSGTVCPDPGVVEGAVVGSPRGIWVFLPLMLGIYSSWAGLCARSGERCQCMYSMCLQHWLLQG